MDLNVSREFAYRFLVGIGLVVFLRTISLMSPKYGKERVQLGTITALIPFPKSNS